ncbi:hypothetical protein PSTG_12731 [Puccinia striiformis f. sp. tritici PST-78]|uniref:DUF4219 domain-containing protein n=1 Tax=Puccinia striiformis f. sp. tritici PST-78 TaxID=1165861 RepID=A0A0L0V3P1_9BASI|nr:hypothetical protein PSTG_12731 [Puccinia striiformis f. sp. tritici PST-78]
MSLSDLDNKSIKETKENKGTKPNTSNTQITETLQMDSLASTIIPSCIKALPLLTENNFSKWKSQILTIFEMLGIKDVFILGKGELSTKTELLVRGMIMIKLDSKTIASVINQDNKTDVLKIWTSIINEFASTDEANRRHIWSELSYLPFSKTDIHGFIVKVKALLVKMREVGIIIDSDIVGFEIVKKFPNTTEMTQHTKNVASSAPTTQPLQVALFTDASKLCKPNAHNTLSNHPGAKCWKLYPHLRPAFPYAYLTQVG